MKSKKCIKCNQLKPLSEFVKAKQLKSGVTGKCKECMKACAKDRYHNGGGKDGSILATRKYRENNKDKCAAYERAYRENNKEAKAKWSKEYLAKNKDDIYAKRAKYREDNKEKVREQVRRSKSKNKEGVAEYTRLYRENNPKIYKAHGAVSAARASGKLTQNKCEICNSSNTEAHHDDYNKPLDVRWLCSKHHNKWHRNNNPIK